MKLLMRLALAVSVLPCASLANPIVVRTGEHGDFTRVVLHIRPNDTWNLDSEGKQYKISFADKRADFDLSDTFVRIDRNRLSAVAASPGVLDLTLGCECEIEADNSSGDMLVLDIRPADANNAKHVSEGSKSERPVFEEQQRFPEGSSSARLQEAPIDDVVNPDVAQLVKNSERDLIEQLSRASGLGLANFQIKPTSPSVAVVKHGGEVGSNSVNLHAFPNLDGEIEREMSEDNAGAVQAPCISNSTMSSIFHEYTDGFSNSLAKLRSKLAADGDGVDETLQLELAKLYLSFGLGDEVKSLVYSSNQNQMWELISDLADAISNPNDINGAFDRYSSCNSDIAFWVVLGGGKSSGVGGKRLLSSSSVFLKLPEHLQEVLAPRFAEILMDRGEDELAQTVLRKANGGYELEPQLELELPGSDGASVSAKFDHAQIVSQLIAKNSEMAPMHLADYVWREVRAGRNVDIEASELLKSYYNQYRESDISKDLLEALVLADTSSGRFSTAYKMLVDTNIQNPEILKIFFEQLAAKATDYQFLKYTTLLAEYNEGNVIHENSRDSDRMKKLEIFDDSHAFLSPVPRKLVGWLEVERSVAANIPDHPPQAHRIKDTLPESPLSFGGKLLGQSIELRQVVAQSMAGMEITE